MSFKDFFSLTVIPVVSEHQANNHHSRTHVWKQRAVPFQDRNRAKISVKEKDLHLTFYTWETTT